MKNKKVLIMSASIGTGHTQAARAVEEYLKSFSPSYDVEHVDFLSNDVLSIDNLVKETYIKILDVFPMLYDMMYYSSQGYKKGMLVKTLMSWGLKRRMMRMIAEKKPDLIVFTHPFPAAAACLLKRQRRIHIPLVGVITDFAIHQLWIYRQMDLYCVAASQLKDELVRQGISSSRIVVSGIPIRKAFLQEQWQGQAAGSHEKNVLIMGGGLGMGSIKKTLILLDALDNVSSFTVVAGHNSDLFDEVSQMRNDLRHPVSVYGYTNHIPELMARTTLLVTKPGALTCTEGATVQVPMVLYSAIPGQEEANASYLAEKGCACWVKTADEMVHTVSTLLDDPDRLERMAKACTGCHRDGALIVSRHVIRFLEKGKVPVQGLSHIQGCTER